jgi:hypothetical protein
LWGFATSSDALLPMQNPHARFAHAGFFIHLKIVGKKVEVSVNGMSERFCALNFAVIEPLEKKQRR